MKTHFKKFPKIGQFKDVVRAVKMNAEFRGLDADEKPIYDAYAVKPTLRFSGTVKLHGTNAAIGMSKDQLWCQKRTALCTVEKDNAGFAAFIDKNWDEAAKLLDAAVFFHSVDLETHDIIIYGEWCGAGIQKGVAISELPKMFVMFGARIVPHDDELPTTWEAAPTGSKHEQFKNIEHFETFGCIIDFNTPEQMQNELIALTERVENECPVGKALGVSGIGEGIVWTCEHQGNAYRFKVKGEKHSVTKVKKLASIDPEKVKSIREFINITVTENRLKQGLENMTHDGVGYDIKETGKFVNWIKNDVLSEDMDILHSNNLIPADVIRELSKAASTWFHKNL